MTCTKYMILKANAVICGIDLPIVTHKKTAITLSASQIKFAELSDRRECMSK